MNYKCECGLEFSDEECSGNPLDYGCPVCGSFFLEEEINKGEG